MGLLNQDSSFAILDEKGNPVFIYIEPKSSITAKEKLAKVREEEEKAAKAKEK
jgi:hypothetical protein